jgi:hypothetical protein
MISLEARGVLENKFKEQFRRRRPWQVDWSEDGNVNFLEENAVERNEKHEAD